jgi:hypothetical protein
MFAEIALGFRLAAKTRFPFIQADRSVSGSAFPTLPSSRKHIVPPLEQGHEEPDFFHGIRLCFEAEPRFGWGGILLKPFLRRPVSRGFGQTQPGLQELVLFFQCLVFGARPDAFAATFLNPLRLTQKERTSLEVIDSGFWSEKWSRYFA